MSNSSALRIFIAIALGIVFIAMALNQYPGSILGALIDAEDLEQL